MHRYDASNSCLVLVGIATLGIFAVSCKEPNRTYYEDGEEKIVMSHRDTQVEFYAADAEYLQKNSKFFFSVWQKSFIRKLDDLPTLGEVPTAKKPYSGGYYAEPDGGTNQRMVGGKSPLEKYDEAFYGGQNKSVAWEGAKHSSTTAWAGHCNGFSASAQRHAKEPANAVVRNGVSFAPEDIKALLSEIYMNADYEFLGGNRCEERTPPAPGSRQDPTVMGNCEDINPGTLHTTIANWLGRMQHTLIMDMFPGDQVWNYPLYRYEVVSMDKNLNAAEARRYVTGGAGNYQFNPNAARFAYVQARLTYAEGTRRESLGKLIPGTMDLQYILELDGSGDIIGGEWVGRSQQTHPDFLWVALEPMTPNGTRYMGNPHIDNGEVIKMWAESVGYDANNPPLDIKRPLRIDSWGKWPYFEVTLDGGNHGSVFAGKKTNLQIKRKSPLMGADISLALGLNGVPLTTIDDADSETIAYAFEPGPGMSRLQFTWKKAGTPLEEEFLRFHVVP